MPKMWTALLAFGVLGLAAVAVACSPVAALNLLVPRGGYHAVRDVAYPPALMVGAGGYRNPLGGDFERAVKSAGHDFAFGSDCGDSFDQQMVGGAVDNLETETIRLQARQIRTTTYLYF